MQCADYFWLRSAGFPAESLLHAAPFSQNPALNTLLDFYQRRKQLAQHFGRHITAVGEEHCRKFVRKLNEQHPVSVSDLPLVLREVLAQPLAEWQQLTLTIAEQEDLLRPEFAEFSEQTRQQLIDFLLQDEVAEAIFISNPDAAQRIEALIAERHAPNDSRKKQKIRLGWSYAQRFCTKNDTCSFFGPIAWGRFDPQQAARVQIHRHEGHWLSQRETFFESWVMQRLTAQINQQCPTPEHLPLILNPGCHLHGETLHYPLNKSRQLNGTLLEIVSMLAQRHSSENALCEHLNSNVKAAIEHLVASGIVQRGFALSPRDPDALNTLLQKIRATKLPADFIALWSERFSHLEALRETYAGGDLPQRQRALAALNEALSAAGVSLQRESGKMYVGRYPVYEDCARSSSVTFSRDLQRQLDSDLAPLMALYQWLTRSCAFLLHQAWLTIYQELAAAKQQNAISLLAFLHALQPRQAATQQQICSQIRAMLDEAWQPLLTSMRDEELRLTPEPLTQVLRALQQQNTAAAAFQVFGDNFHSPDLMLSATSQAALNRGEYQIVLGETHPGVHTLSQPVAAPFCPFTREIEAAFNELLGRERMMLADSPEGYQRSHIDWPLVTNYAQLILPGGGGTVAISRRYPVGRALLFCREGRLTVGDREDWFEEDLLCVNATALHQLLFTLAGDVVPRHDPRRILLNRCVLKRRTWVFHGEGWPESATDEFASFLQWQCWRQQNQLPRWIFVKCDSEPKPLFVDFDNPLSLDALATALKKAKTINVSEMLPAPDALWLEDQRGRVCCEIRTTFSPKSQEIAENVE
ncbi:lantibiotic dehydratase [Enterobacter ludwigii]